MRILNSTYILEAHNLWARAQWTKLLDDMAKSYVLGQVKLQEIFNVLQLGIKYNEFHTFVKYVEKIIDTNKFVPLRKRTVTKSLFGAKKLPTDHPKKALYEKILASYSRFHNKKL